jgi:hypothetical protein
MIFLGTEEVFTMKGCKAKVTNKMKQGKTSKPRSSSLSSK